MLNRFRSSAYCVKEDSAVFGFEENDFDLDSDFDPEEVKSQQADALDAHFSRQ